MGNCQRKEIAARRASPSSGVLFPRGGQARKAGLKTQMGRLRLCRPHGGACRRPIIKVKPPLQMCCGEPRRRRPTKGQDRHLELCRARFKHVLQATFKGGEEWCGSGGRGQGIRGQVHRGPRPARRGRQRLDHRRNTCQRPRAHDALFFFSFCSLCYCVVVFLPRVGGQDHRDLPRQDVATICGLDLSARTMVRRG